MARRSLLPPQTAGRPTIEMATVVVRYPAARGRVRLRGSAPPLDWEVDTEPSTVDGDVSVFRVPVPHGTIEMKVVREDGAWAFGRNLVLSGRDVIEIAPSFDDEAGQLATWWDISGDGGEPPIRVRLFLPPGYDEHISTRYPVLYCLDGQALYHDGQDPYGVWNLDHALDDLWALGVVEKLIVVGIDTADARLDRLGPVADAQYGGGNGEAFLDRIARVLIPRIDAELRTDPASRAILGASMGGLFSFFAAWRRPDLFEAAICLSSSFWWADRWMIREVSRTPCPNPRPLIYLDSGATSSPFAEDADLRDGQHHTRAMLRGLVDHCYVLGEDLHVLAFPGQPHAATAWGARVAVPLQLIFPKAG